MDNVFDKRRENLRKLVDDWGGPASLSRKLGYSNGSYLAQLVGPNPRREVGERLARSIEEKLGLPTLWLDGQPKAAPRINDDLLAQCLQSVAVAIEESKRKIPSDRQATLATLVYEQASETGKVDQAYVKRLLSLVK